MSQIPASIPIKLGYAGKVKSAIDEYNKGVAPMIISNPMSRFLNGPMGWESGSDFDGDETLNPTENNFNLVF